MRGVGEESAKIFMSQAASGTILRVTAAYKIHYKLFEEGY
jgi:hypothetical protein